MDDRAHAVAIDSQGNALVAGYVGPEFLCEGSDLQGFVTKLDPDGNQIWFHLVDRSGVIAVAVDAPGGTEVGDQSRGQRREPGLGIGMDVVALLDEPYGIEPLHGRDDNMG